MLDAVSQLWKSGEDPLSPKNVAAARYLLVRLAYWFVAIYLRILQTVLMVFGVCWPSVERMVQHASTLADERQLPAADKPERIRICQRGGRKFLAKGNEEVVVVGGNYVLKHAPYFPAKEDVEADCKLVVENLKKGTWDVPGKTIVPCWRLGCLWAGAMPTPGKLDEAWVARLRETVAIFEAHGIYCFLHVHQDAMCSTNGGEGIPHWVAEHFQANPEYPGASYLVSPSHPLEIALPKALEPLWSKLVKIQTAEADGEEDPWMAFSVEDKAPGRDPSLMNIGNPSIRLNNYGESWRNGILFLSKQVQNLASRLYRSHNVAIDQPVFDGYVQLLACLSAVHSDYANVIAIETMNEPPMGGLWDVFIGRPLRLLRMRSDLWSFQAAALERLDALGFTDVAVAVTDVGQAMPGFSMATLLLALIDPMPFWAWRTFRKWAAQRRLLLSFHYYAPPTACSFMCASLRARLFGQVLSGSLSGVPTFLSEFVEAEAADVAEDIERSVEVGTSAVAYWQFVSAKKTHTMDVHGKPVVFHKQPDGWAAYAAPVTPPVPKTDGSLCKYAVCDTLEEFRVYQKQVERGEFWGAAITQFGGAEVKHSVLHKLSNSLLGYRERKTLSLAAAAGVFEQLADDRRQERKQNLTRLRAAFNRPAKADGASRAFAAAAAAKRKNA